MARQSIFGMEKLFSLIQNVHTASGTHLASYSTFTEFLSSEGKATGE
jgi:hypothetical protein